MADASGPSKAEGSKELHDGDTTVQVDTNASLRSKYPVDFRNNINEAIKQKNSGQYPPCINPSCKSYGRSHPNCLCYAPGGESEQQERTILAFAHGGFCSAQRAHKSDCPHFAEGGDVEDNMQYAQDPEMAVDHSIANHGLLHTITKTGFSKSEDPDRTHMDFLDSHKRGKGMLQKHANDMTDPKAEGVESNADDIGALKDHMSMVAHDPMSLMNVGGDLGDRYPALKTQLIGKASNAINYLSSIKPMNSQGSPLDPVNKPSKMAESQYDRQVSIAQNPRLIFQHAKDGTIIPQDLKTISTLYPKLSQSIVANVTKTLIENKKGLTIKQKRSLSALSGQDLMFTQSPGAMQAIMHANSGMNQGTLGSAPKKASGVELKQINEVNKLDSTNLQARLADRK